VIAALTFGAPQPAGARALRPIAFAARSTLPLSAACLVANGVRETLSRLLAVELEVDLIEPAIPGAGERRVLLEGATILRVRGRLCDGFVILRPADAQRLVALAFGEDERCERAPLSEIESATLDRIASALVPLCNTLCGTLGPVTRELAERAACDLAAYFEVRTTGRVRVALGFGLSRDPAEEIGERITLDDLADVELEGTVEFGRGTLRVPAFSRLACGVTLALDTPLGGPGALRFGDVRFARGDCGVVSGRNAFCCESDRERGAA
jgi:flagellar motor switch/type III secretory pathway protein FliN